MAGPDPWILTAIANEGMLYSGAMAAVSSNSTDPDDDTAWDGVSMTIKSSLPMLTLALGTVASYLLEYVFENVVFTLASVETPIPGGVDSEKTGSERYGLLDDKKHDDKQLVAVSKPHYVTSSIRATLRHLQAEAGDLSMFRGLGAESTVRVLMIPIALAFEFVYTRITGIERYSGLVSGTVAWLILAQAFAACTHMVISKPRHKFWFRRLPLSWFGVLKRMWVSILSIAITEELIDLAWRKMSPQSLTPSENFATKTSPNNSLLTISDGPIVPLSVLPMAWLLLKALIRGQIRPFVKMLITSPLQVIHNRIQASMLPDTEDPVIPMDRNFKGRPQHGILQQPQEPLTIIQASRTLDKQTYIRLLKLDIKFHVITEVLTWFFWTLIFVEVLFLVGHDCVWVVLKMVMGSPVVVKDLDFIPNSARTIILNLAYVNGSVPVQNSTAVAAAATQTNLTSTVLASVF